VNNLPRVARGADGTQTCASDALTTTPHYVCKTYTITQKILERSTPFFLSTFGTLGQHEFAFGFCGSCGRDPSSLSTLVII